MISIEPVTLRGERIRLEPLEAHHADELARVGTAPELWQFSPGAVTTAPEMAAYIHSALKARDAGTALPFVIIDQATNQAVGSTRFGNVDAANRKVEIGWTWITPKFQRSFVNTEAKLLMLIHAFETWQCGRVELKTDALNERSRAAILRIGAMEEGILRKHMITSTGRSRDTVYFSILEDEWPAVKERLVRRLERK